MKPIRTTSQMESFEFERLEKKKSFLSKENSAAPVSPFKGESNHKPVQEFKSGFGDKTFDE